MAGVNILLIEDVECLGRSGALVAVRAGYARNYLLPQKKGVVATKQTLRMQKKLVEERALQAAKDLEEAKVLASRLEGIEIKTEVKVDPEGHMYGSVSAFDIVHLLEAQGVSLEKRFVQLAHPIKELGIHNIVLKLKEGVPAQVLLKILPEGIDEEEFFGALAEQGEIQGDPMYQDYYNQ